ncbi:MAG: amidohydrolase family protein [Chromatiales bacterium]|jgi:predicted TIM-barrel fold metal-dependent hydrolase
MKTVDIHTHLMSPQTRYDRLFDKFTIRFFAKGLGVEAKALLADPYETYVASMAKSIGESTYVEKACLFGVDSRLNEQGQEVHRDKTICAMTEDVLTVAQRYADAFIPFLSVNPRRLNALDLLDEYVERGCRGAKFLQNYWAIDLNDERFIPYYEKLVSHDLPLIVHVGSEYTINSDARYEGTEILDLPLKCGVTVIAAHMGLGRVIHKLRPWRNLSRQPRYFDSDYFQLLEMLERHDNLYADISAILVPFRARALRHLAEQKQVHPKILFGSDFPVPYTIRINSYDLTATKRKEISRVSNPFDRYVAAILEYFPADSVIYTNHRKVIRSP